MSVWLCEPPNISRLGYFSVTVETILNAIGAVYVIGYVIAARNDRASRFLMMWPLVFLGRISYSVYVFHYPIIGALAFVAWRIVPPEHYVLAQLTCACLAVPTTIAAGYAGYRFIERPTQRLGRSLAAALCVRQRAAVETHA